MPPRFAALEQRDFRILWAGGLFSFMGVQMQFFLRGILAWDLTEREGALGLVYFIFGIALLVATPLGGVASDRLPRRQVMLVSLGLLVTSAAGMSAAVLTGVVQYWMLLVASVLQGTAFGFFGPARMAMTSDLLGRGQLGNALSLQSLAMNGSRIFAPSLAGALAGWALFGIGGAYAASATISSVSLILTVWLPNPPAALTGRTRPFSDIANGVRYVRDVPGIRSIVLTTFAILMFAFSYVSFTPALVKDVFGLGNEAVGAFTSAASVGALIAGLWVAGLADSHRARGIMTGAGMLFGLTVALFGVAPTYVIAVVVAGVAGAGTTTYQTLSNTLALQQSDSAFQGRVQSIMQLGFAGFGMAALPLGLVAEAIGLRATLVIMGTIAASAAALYGMIGGELNDPDRSVTAGIATRGAGTPRLAPAGRARP